MNKRILTINNKNFYDITGLKKYDYLNIEYLTKIKYDYLTGARGLYKSVSVYKSRANNNIIKWLYETYNTSNINMIKYVGNSSTFSIYIVLTFEDDTAILLYFTAYNNYFKRLY